MEGIDLSHMAVWLCVIVSAVTAIAIPRHATIVSRQEVTKANYDFIIAGGGISGLTVADRLTEDPKGRPLKHTGLTRSLTFCDSESPGH